MFKNLLATLIVLCSSVVAFAQPGSNLVLPENATHIAVKDGSWQDELTWEPILGYAEVPTENAKVHIPDGIRVTNHGVTANLQWIHVDGTLDVCTHCDTEINVHTLYIDMSGHFHMGKPGMPVEATAKLQYKGNGFLPGDWQKISLGTICHGEFTAVGLEKTCWTIIDNSNLPIGSTKLKLIEVPVRWKIGDKIAIAGTDSLVGESWVKYQTEYRTITKITGKELEFSPPLQYRHYRWKNDLPFHIVNLDKNAVIKTKDPDFISSSGIPINTRGHNMFMSPMNTMIDVLEHNLGRTDKSKDVTDPRIDPISLELVAGSDTNPRGRYADHNHKCGPLKGIATRKRVVVRGSPGWGLVNHDSNCEWDDCVCTECFGSAFTTEEGQERGYMRRCLAFMNRGQGDYITSTDADHGIEAIGDWGKDGAGFWLQGALVDVVDCVSFDNSGRGFALFNRTLNGYPAIHSSVPPHLHFKILHDFSLLSEEYSTVSHGDSPHAPASAVLLRLFHNNVAYGNRVGVQGWNAGDYNSSSSRVLPYGVMGNITNLTLWGRGNQLHFEYARNFNVRNIRIVGDSVSRGPIGRWSSTNAGHPIHLRGPNVSIWGVKIEDCLNRNNWPNPISIYTDTNNSTEPDNFKIEGNYPVVDKDGIPIILPQP